MAASIIVISDETADKEDYRNFTDEENAVIPFIFEFLHAFRHFPAIVLEVDILGGILEFFLIDDGLSGD